MPERFYAEAEELRARLLAWRFRRAPEPKRDEENDPLADRLKEVRALAIVAPGRLRQILIVLRLEVGLDQPAKRTCLWCFRSLRFGDGADRFALSEELG
jgi:hypothetical protein